MTGTLSLWTTGPAGMARILQDGRVPTGAVTVAFAAPAAAVPPDAVLELVSDDRSVTPMRVTGPPGPWLWVTHRGALAGAARWQAVLIHDEDVVASLDVVLEGLEAQAEQEDFDAAGEWTDDEPAGCPLHDLEAGDEPAPGPTPSRPPRVLELRIEAILHDGSRRSAADAEAIDVALLAVTAELDPEAAPTGSITLRVDDPTGASLSSPADVTADDPSPGDPAGWLRATATILGRPFMNGDWTLSLFHDRTLLRRARLRLAHSPLRVRAATVLALGPGGARPLGSRLAPDQSAGRLVFAYALDGLCLGARATATFSIRDANGAQLAGWSVSVDRGDVAALERAWFAVPPGLLAQAHGPLQVRLALDGAEAHTQQLELEAPRFRSDGTVLEAPIASGPPPGLGAAGTFFGLVERIRRRRKTAEPLTAEPAPGDDELPF